MSNIRTCDASLILHTETSSSSNYFDQEVGMALAYRTPIIPICIGQKPYGFINMKKCIFCDDSITDKIQSIACAIRVQYWNQRQTPSNVLFRINMATRELQAIRLLSLLTEQTLQKDEINQLAMMYLSDRFSKEKTILILEKLLTKNRANLSDRIHSTLRKYNNKNLKV